MEIYIIYTEQAMMISKKKYSSWREIQDDFSDYKTSLGPFETAEVVGYLNDEYECLGLSPSAFEQVENLVHGRQECEVLNFERSL